MSPRYKPKLRQVPELEHLSPAEFRSEARRASSPRAFSGDSAFWKYVTSPPVPAPMGGSLYMLDREEHRVLSKASNGAGAYLVPAAGLGGVSPRAAR